MTDLEVIAAIRRRMSGIEKELAVDPPVTATQWLWAMAEYTKEMVAAFAMPASAPPTNRDVPQIAGTGAVGEILTVTLGNWDGEPTDYSFKWTRDASLDVGGNTITYRADTADVDHDIACVVSAINSKGTTAAPPSNAIKITSRGTGAARSAAPSTAPRPPSAR